MSVEKFLAQRAVNVVVSGNYTLSNWLDANGKPRQFACRTSRVSPFRMMVDVPVVGRVGDTITTYFGNFGKLEGLISDTAGRSFLLELEMTRAMRQKLSDQLTWLEKKQKDPGVKDERKQARIIPASPHSMLTFADGSIKSCFVVDMSVSGAAISADLPLPEIGMPLAVGSCVGRVVRHLDGGFAVKFIEHQNRDHLERRIIRAMPAYIPRKSMRFDTTDEDQAVEDQPIDDQPIEDGAVRDMAEKPEPQHAPIDFGL